jgi:N-carbamoylputrescine amidase
MPPCFHIRNKPCPRPKVLPALPPRGVSGIGLELGLMNQSKMNLAVLGMRPGPNPRENLEKCSVLAERAAEQGAALVIPPAMFQTPPFWRTEDHANFALAEAIPGPAVEALSRLAAALNIVIVVPVFERRTAGVFHSSAAVIDAGGRLAGVHRQMHLRIDPESHEGFYFAPGDLGFQAFQTRGGKVAVLLGWDQWYPEAARIAALGGAQILACPGAGADERDYPAWQAILRSHAIANNVFVAAADRSGAGFIAGPSGKVLAEGTEIVSAECDLRDVEITRTHWPFFRDRRLDAYTGITKRWSD